jgi:hypothetical protein
MGLGMGLGTGLDIVLVWLYSWKLEALLSSIVDVCANGCRTSNDRKHEGKQYWLKGCMDE